TAAPRWMMSRSSPFRHERCITSEDSSSSITERRASTSSEVRLVISVEVGAAGLRLEAMVSCSGTRGDTREILPVTGVDLEDVAFVDEQGHVHLVAGLEHCRLGGAGHRVPPHAWVALGHLEVDRVGERHPQRLAVVEEDRRVDVLFEEVLRIREHLLGHE